MDVQTVESNLKKRPIPRWLAREKESGRIYHWAMIASGVLLLVFVLVGFIAFAIVSAVFKVSGSFKMG